MAAGGAAVAVASGGGREGQGAAGSAVAVATAAAAAAAATTATADEDTAAGPPLGFAASAEPPIIGSVESFLAARAGHSVPFERNKLTYSITV